MMSIKIRNQTGTVQFLPLLVIMVLAVGLVVALNQAQTRQTLTSEAKGPRPKAVATCAVTPNPVPVGSIYKLSGTVNPVQAIDIRTQSAQGTSIMWPHVCDGKEPTPAPGQPPEPPCTYGTWSVDPWAGIVGTYNVTVEGDVHNKLTALGTCSFDVVNPTPAPSP